MESDFGVPRPPRHFLDGIQSPDPIHDFKELVLCPAMEGWRARGGVFITGPNGSGKSHLAAHVCDWAGGAETWRWFSCAELPFRLRAPTSFGLLEYLRYVPRLVLDDLVAGVRGEEALSFLVALLDHRLTTRNRLTIVTSDRTLQQLEAMDSSIASRLGGLQYVTVEGRDRRLDG